MKLPEYIWSGTGLSCLFVGIFTIIVFGVTKQHWFGWICLPLGNLCFFWSGAGFMDDYHYWKQKG